MTKTSLDDALWASLMLTMRQVPRAWKHDEAMRRRFVEAALWNGRTGAPWRDLPDELGHWHSVHHRFRRWSVRGWWNLVVEALRPALPADGLVLLDSTTCKAHRAATRRRNASAAAVAAYAPSPANLSVRRFPANREVRRFMSVQAAQAASCRFCQAPGQHSDLRYAPALGSGIPAHDATLDSGYVSARLRAGFAADGCTVHTPPKLGMPKLGMVDPTPWGTAIYVRRRHVENLFSKLKDWSRIALRRDKTRQSWIGFARLIASVINLRVAEFSHRP